MNATSELRGRGRRAAVARAAGTAAALAVLAVTATACGTSAAAQLGALPPTSSAAAGSDGAAAQPPAAPPPTAPPPAAPAASAAPPPAAPAQGNDACSLPEINAIAGEPASADAQRMASWVTLQSNGWTVIVPAGDWHLSASAAGGADVFSPDGGSAANLGDHESQTPWTLSALSQLALSSVSDINVICRSAIERGSGLTTQAVEVTGDYQRTRIHAVVVLSLLTPTTADFFTGEIRSIYTPAAEWSGAAEQALWLIVKHAILVPEQP